jgi:hypothetical protein
MAPNVESITQELEKLDLQQLARTKGRYLVYPETKVRITIPVQKKRMVMDIHYYYFQKKTVPQP